MNTIIDQLPVWVTAITPKSRGKKNGIDNISPYGIQRLRELILELAVRGKLVPQDSTDEPASVLLEKIAAERKRLVDAGKIKKQKKLPKVIDEEKPFELPKSWEWVSLSMLASFENGDRSKNYPNKSVLVENGVPFINAGHLQNGQINLVEMNYISEDRFNLLRSGKVQDGDILYCLRGSLGKIAIVKDIKKGAIASSLVIIRAHNKSVNNYLMNYFGSTFSDKIMRNYDNGTAQPNLSASDLAKFIVPLPPLAEQHRIVAKVDELMALCEQLEAQQMNQLETHTKLTTALLATLTATKNAEELKAAWQQLEPHFEVLFTTEESIEQLKQTILQLAVMGKLVPQDPNDEPASILLKKIAIEKKRLIAEGKIKKQKPLSKITDEEKPFELPKGWKWVRLGEITDKIGSGSTPRGGKNAYVDTGIIFLRSQNIRNEGILLDDVAFITEETNQKMSNTIVLPDDILLNITGGSLGRSTIFPKDLKVANVSQHVTIVRLTVKSSVRYLHLSILSPYIQDLIWGRQVGANREGLSKRILELFEIPVPPLSEQHRIVERVDELFVLCDTLKERIQEVQEVKIKLADAATNF